MALDLTTSSLASASSSPPIPSPALPPAQDKLMVDIDTSDPIPMKVKPKLNLTTNNTTSATTTIPTMTNMSSKGFIDPHRNHLPRRKAREQTRPRITRERSKTAPLPNLERDTLAETQSLSDVDDSEGPGYALSEGRLEVELASDKEALLRSSTLNNAMALSTSPTTTLPVPAVTTISTKVSHGQDWVDLGSRANPIPAAAAAVSPRWWNEASSIQQQLHHSRLP